MSTPSNTAIKTIHDSLKDRFNNTMTFPEHVKAVMAAGVIRYKVDLVKKNLRDLINLFYMESCPLSIA